jgi:hypothetical protein
LALFVIIKMPKRAGSVGKQNVEAGQKERGGWPKNAFCGQNVKNAGQKKIYNAAVVVEGLFCGLRPQGAATLVEGGVAYAAEYDGARTIAEAPVPVRKQVPPPPPRARIPTDG